MAAARTIEMARQVIPSYANGLKPTPEVSLGRLVHSLSAEVAYKPLGVPSLILPPIGGIRFVLIDEELHRPTRQFVLRHELSHYLNGDADEATYLHFPYPLPDAETISDLFAFADLISAAECEAGPEWVGKRMRKLVTLDYEPWYRRLEVDRLPSQLIRLRHMLDG